MVLMDTILEKILEAASSGRSRIAVCASYGVSCEGWLKVELLHKLAVSIASTDDVEILPEAENIDITIRRDAERVLLELKTFPTNYERGGGKPITNFIDGVIEDLAKLTSKRGPSDKGLAVWLAYTAPEPVPPAWPGHLRKVEAAAVATLRAERIPLWGNAFANLYVMESK